MSSPNVGPLRLILINAQSADETTSVPVDVLGRTDIAFYVQGNGTTSSGVLTLEEADYDPSKEAIYGGTWSSISTTNASDVDGGKQKALHLTQAAYGHVRARISTAIGGGGTLTVRIVAQ